MWHVMIMGNPHSVMFEVAWCVILYSLVLALEFSPNVFRRFRLQGALNAIHRITVPLVIAGVLLSTLHQSSLGTVFLIVPGKLHQLWYSPYLPLMFFFSAVTVGFAMIIFESYLSSHVFRKGLEHGLIVTLSRFLLLALIFYLAIKFEDLFARGALGALLEPSLESKCFWLEILLLLAPALLLTRERIRANEHATFLCATSVVLGVIVNRLNVAIVGLYASAGVIYLPSASELVISLFLVTVGVIVFGLAVRYLNIFEASDPAAAHHAPAEERTHAS
jgi:Ni/Fe-hydrogenase subunit HybB-like protein